MKRIVTFFFALAMVFGVYFQANAFLYDRGADSLGYHLIYDSDLKITWYDYSQPQDTWQNQVNWADALTVNFGGNIYDNWRLPTTVDGPFVHGFDSTTTGGYNITTSELGHLFYTELNNKGDRAKDGTYYSNEVVGLITTNPFINLDGFYHWSGTDFSLDETLDSTTDYDYAWAFNFNNGNQNPEAKFIHFYGLAVLPGDVVSAQVAEPTTMLLLGLGLIGLAGVKRKVQK